MNFLLSPHICNLSSSVTSTDFAFAFAILIHALLHLSVLNLFTSYVYYRGHISTYTVGNCSRCILPCPMILWDGCIDSATFIKVP